DRESRLELRQILRETVRRIVLERSDGDVWVRLVGGTITLHDGATINFNIGYNTRRKGYIVAWQNTEDEWVTHGPSRPRCHIDTMACHDLSPAQLTSHLRAALMRMHLIENIPAV